MKTCKTLPVLIVAAVMLGFCALSHGQGVTLRSDEERLLESFSWLPYAFSSASFGLGVGVGGSYSGWPEEPSSVLGSVAVGTKGSYNIASVFSEFRVPGTQRLYTSPMFMFGRYQEQFLYVGQNNPGFEDERAGSNDSDVDNYIEATQWDNRIEFEMRYLLPIGHGRDDDGIVNRYVIREGLLVSGATGGTSWNPLKSGRSRLIVTPAWREQTLEKDDLEVPLQTLNVEVALERNNHDFPFNPTYGSYQKVAYQRDFDDNEQLGEWESWKVELSKVFNLGQTDMFKQQVIALDFASAYVPTWETQTVDGREVVTKRPPQYEGATLGGIRHMRAYEDARFHDKAAVYYAAEYRVIPEWQPLRNVDMLQWADISYWQWVLFCETGQVAPHWNVNDLHSDLHVDGGISLRGMLHKAVCRLDVAVGEEGARVVAMYGHPF